MGWQLAATVCLILTAGAVSPAFSQSAPWLDFVSSEDGFAVSFPGMPNVERRAPETPRQVRVTQYNFEAVDGYYVVDVTEYIKATAPSREVQVLAGSRDAAARAVNGRIVNEIPLVLGTYPGLQFDIEAAKIRTRVRFYSVGTRFFQLHCAVLASMPFPREVDRFFQSFRLLEGSR